MTTPPTVVGVGGAHIDRRGQVSGIYVPGASNPGVMAEDIGGGVFNALRSVRMRGLNAGLMSLRGGDSAGERIAAAIASAGIADLSATFLDRSTASYTALIDRDGDLIAGFADMGLYDLFPRQLRRRDCRAAIAAADAVMVDTNVPADALAQVVACATAPISAIGISPAKVIRLAGILDRIDCLFINRREAATLGALALDTDMPRIIAALRRQGARRGVITDGGRATILFDASQILSIAPPAPRTIVDVTGAGDALAGATLAALVSGASLSEAVRDGMAAALLALESPHAVPDMTPDSFAAARALVPEPLDIA